MGYSRLLKEIGVGKQAPVVAVGVQRADIGSHPSRTNLALIAAANEFGTADGRIPARPFIRSTMAEHFEDFIGLNRIFLDRIIRGKETIISALGKIGLVIAAAIQKKITDIDTPPNKPSTIRQKGSENPLIDTGTLRRSIRHVVEPRSRHALGRTARALDYVRRRERARK